LNSPASVTGTNARRVTFGSGHPGGANFVMCDGSVVFISNGINFGTYQQLSIPNDNKLLQWP
jgi:prepilin-type processing-associated H-X9-DG protein